MLALKFLLIAGGLGMILVAVSILAYDLYRESLYRRALALPGAGAVPPLPQWRWRSSLAPALLAWGPILLAFSIVVVSSGMAGIRVSEMTGTVLGTLYPGVHFWGPAGRGRCAVRHARPGLHHGSAGGWKEGRG
jgi:hypothetical protein